ncbi:hypothetical protein [Marivirga harenae]|uniref:hypothetical protein n=1 Tax=Marivirga harenae TaxID=2010992 RepID=UPI0026DEDF31|nr:hypothetical protein [Marivirga harenae]WKV14031.1 hypothetical protein Q3Y49_09350 [Marivirga harenae]
MKIILFTITFFVSLSINGQGLHDRHPELSKFAKNIDNQLESYKSVILENEEFLENMTDGGGILKGYFSGDKIVKIELWAGVSNGKHEFDYYFKDSELYYIVESFKRYSYDVDSDTWDYSKMDQVFHGDYLFSPTFDYETMGHNRFENDEIDPEEILAEEVEKYLTLLDEKRNER